MFFFHHIGSSGSQRDFPKTVTSQVEIDEFASLLNDQTDTIDRLQARFPSGYCNAWGVPAGASSVVRNMDDGDHVLLVAHTAGEGLVPALCANVVVAHGQNWELSQHFWGEQKFPLIFFFDTEELDLTWREMCHDLGFKENYNPRYFLRIGDDRLERVGGKDGYLSHLRGKWGQRLDPFEMPSEEDERSLGEELLSAQYLISEQLQAMRLEAAQEPTLQSGLQKTVEERAQYARDKAFRLAVLKAYDWKCAICQSSLLSPKGAYALEAAHIFPKRLDGSDDPRNGLALCAPHHWAFDVGWFSLTDDLEVMVRDDLPDSHDYSFIRDYKGAPINRPKQSGLVPAALFLKQHRRMHAFDNTDDNDDRGSEP